MVSGFVTIEDGGWAFCPEGGFEGHRWHRIEPVGLSDLVRMGATLIAGVQLGASAKIMGAESVAATATPAKKRAAYVRRPAADSAQ
jgi:hypothetical protein